MTTTTAIDPSEEIVEAAKKACLKMTLYSYQKLKGTDYVVYFFGKGMSLIKAEAMDGTIYDNTNRITFNF